MQAPYLVGVEELLLDSKANLFEVRAFSSRVHYFSISKADILDHLSKRNKHFVR